jgi:hypothetical protein
MEFIKIEQAKALSLLGFSESCIGGFDDRSNELYISYNSYDGECFNREHYLLAPTYAQAFKWFREKHDLDVNIIASWADDNRIYEAEILKDSKEIKVTLEYQSIFGTYSLIYEEAELICLKKLIEIVKNDK